MFSITADGCLKPLQRDCFTKALHCVDSVGDLFVLHSSKQAKLVHYSAVA